VLACNTKFREKSSNCSKVITEETDTYKHDKCKGKKAQDKPRKIRCEDVKCIKLAININFMLKENIIPESRSVKVKFG